MKSLFIVIMLFPAFLFGQYIAMTTGFSGDKFDINDLLYINQSSERIPDAPITSMNSTSPALMGTCVDKIIIEFDPSLGMTGPNDCDGILNGLSALAFAESLSSSVSVGPGVSISAAPPSLQSVSLTRLTDVYSAQLRSLLISGTTIPYIEISFVKNTAGPQVRHILNRYEDCIINSVSSGGSGGESTPSENISFSFTKACYRSFDRNEATGAIITQNDACVDQTLIDQSSCACGSF